MAFRFMIMLIVVGLMSAKGHCQSTVQKILANRPPNCAVPRGYPRTYQHQVTFDEFNVLRIAVQRLEVEMRAIAKEKQGKPGPQGLTGTQGMQGVPGRSGLPGPPGKDAPVDIAERLEDAENRLDDVIDYLNKKINKSEIRSQDSKNPLPSAPHSNVKEKPTAHTDEKHRTPGVVLVPLAKIVGTAYAGPIGGAIATAVVGYAGWFLFGRKKKTPTRQRRYQEVRPPPEYTGKVVQNDGSDGYAEPNPELYEQAVKMAAKGQTGVLGDREVGVNQLQWIANKYAIDNNQM